MHCFYFKALIWKFHLLLKVCLLNLIFFQLLTSKETAAFVQKSTKEKSEKIIVISE
jgi:hypothetical protein